MPMKTARTSIVVAMSRGRRAIGKEGKLLWHISDDLKRFKELTRGHPVIMGRKTFESIVGYLGGPLPGRTNIVVTRNPDYSYDGVVIVSSLEEALIEARKLDDEEIHIGGGADLYAQALPHVDRLYLTLVDAEPEADTFFPPYEDAFTHVIGEKERRDHNGLAYEWVTLARQENSRQGIKQALKLGGVE